MPHHIFFSWQSDTLPRTSRNLVERALQRAIAELRADADIDPADRDLAVDRDTMGVPGSPPLVDTIFAKIDGAAAFLSDLTYVAEREAGGRMPNPNVLLEHGWALKSLTWRRIISVMNVAHGHPDDHELPFDLKHFRRPIFYDCPDNAEAPTRTEARDGLAHQLAAALRAILSDDALHAASGAAAPIEPHPHDVNLLGRVQQQLPESLQRFLRQHSFGTPFRRAILDPLFAMNEDWVGARFEFHDAVLQAAFAELRQLNTDFCALIAERIYAMDSDLSMGWPKTDLDISRGVQSETLTAIEVMNAKAGELSAAIDIFERTARDRIRVAPAAASAAEPVADPREARAREMLDELAADRNRGGLPGIVSRPSVTLRAVPVAAAEGRRIDARDAARAQLRFPPDERVRVQTDSDGRQWWSCDPPRNVGAANSESRWRTRLVRPGAIEFEATIGFREGDDAHIAVDGRQLEMDIVAGLERMGAALAEIGLSGRTLVGIALDGVEDVILLRARGGGRAIGRVQVPLPAIWLDELSGRFADELREPFDIMWQVAGWIDGSPSFDGGSWGGYRTGTPGASR